MANGTIKSEAEYYNNAEKYSGDIGTSTNRCVIEDVYDLLAVSSVTATIEGYHHSHCYCIIVNDIDFNDHDTYKSGVNNTNILNYYKTSYASDTHLTMYIYGDNHCIYNLVCKNFSTFIFTDNITFTNVNFINLCILNSTKLFSGGIKFEFCNFAMYFSNTPLSIIENMHPVSCTFNFYGNLSDIRFGNTSTKLTYTNCQFNFNNVFCYYPASPDGIFCGYNTSYMTTLDTCYFTGSLRLSDDRSAGYRYSPLTLKWFYFTKLLNCYIAIDIIDDFTMDGERFVTHSLFGSVGSCSFMDIELMTAFDSKSITNFHYLTTEQCQDPDYLSSIGFPIIEIENEESDNNSTNVSESNS